jgi:hypothetical protein
VRIGRPFDYMRIMRPFGYVRWGVEIGTRRSTFILAFVQRDEWQVTLTRQGRFVFFLGPGVIPF